MQVPELCDHLGNKLKITIQDEKGRIYREKHDIIRLSSGYEMPLIGLGTWKIPPDKTKEAVLNALNIGYRYIDTAHNYGNEVQIGEAINEWMSTTPADREELFISTKLPVYGNRANDVEKYLLESLAHLQLTYVDLYLIHMPFALKPNKDKDGPLMNENGQVEMEPVDLEEIWMCFQKMIAKGLVRSIGVSNFNESQLIRLVNLNVNGPDNLQIELNVALQQKTLVATCRSCGISVTAYSPLGSPDAPNHFKNKYNFAVPNLDLLNNEVVKNIAKKNGITEAQVLLRFLIQQNIAVIPKSINPDRMRENFQVLNIQLPTKDMEELKELDEGEKARIVTFLQYKGIEDHEEYPF